MGFFALYHNVIMAFVIETEVNIEHKIPIISVIANPLVGPVPNIYRTIGYNKNTSTIKYTYKYNKMEIYTGTIKYTYKYNEMKIYTE